jgi:hypothetical protein
MTNIALLPTDVQILISGYYAKKQVLCLQNDIVGYSNNFKVIVNNDHLKYKLLFWNILNKYMIRPRNIKNIGSIWEFNCTFQNKKKKKLDLKISYL